MFLDHFPSVLEHRIGLLRDRAAEIVRHSHSRHSSCGRSLKTAPGVVSKELRKHKEALEPREQRAERQQG